MAEIYTINGEELAIGLQGCSVCDEARRHARAFAADRDEEVILDDDDGLWIIFPDGSRELSEDM